MQFDQYGRFAGLAENVDSGNQIRNDNAFVLLDAADSDSDIVSTIAHEAGHILGTLDHGGADLARYASFTIQYDYSPIITYSKGLSQNGLHHLQRHRHPR